MGLKSEGPPAGAAPANIIGKCDYYCRRVKDFEERNKDDKCKKPPTYYMSYGYKYCVRFRDDARPTLTSEGQQWLDATLVLLQELMEEAIGRDRVIEYYDDKFTDMAFRTHSPAYWRAGFHGIPIKDKLRVVATPDFKEWLKGATWEQAGDMAVKEAEAYGEDLGDTFDEMADKIRRWLNNQ